MIKMTINEIYNSYDIENNIVNRNAIKCLLKTLIRKGLAKIEGQYYMFDQDSFNYLLDIYKKLLSFFDFFYSLKSDLTSMFDYLLDIKENDSSLSFNAFFCPGYSTNGGYKDYLGNTTTSKLKILSEISEFFKKQKIPHEINCYYCDSYIENCNDKVNPNWYKELLFNRKLFDKEASQYFENKNIYHISDLDIFKTEENLGGHIDPSVIERVNKKVYRSFYIANEAFYKKLGFSKEKMQERNDILVTMYIKVSDYINSIDNGIYLPMENMYDREKIIANNDTCTMYLKQRLVKKNEK